MIEIRLIEYGDADEALDLAKAQEVAQNPMRRCISTAGRWSPSTRSTIFRGIEENTEFSVTPKT